MKGKLKVAKNYKYFRVKLIIMSFAENINGIKICYEIHGDGDPIILVHGFGDKKEVWLAQVGVLAAHYKVITFDNRGAGKSDRPDEPYTMEIYADDIRGLMDFLKIDTTHLIGWSLGGMIIQYFALKYPERLNKLVLINTDYKGTLGEYITQGLLESVELRQRDPTEAFWHTAPFEYHAKFRRDMKADPKKKFYGIWSVEDLIKIYSVDPPTPQDIKNAGQAFETHDNTSRLSEIKHKTLVLAASHDRVTPKSVMLEISEKIPNSIFKVIEKAGHNSILSRAPEVNQLILDFLKN